jgi:hypothetical protein
MPTAARLVRQSVALLAQGREVLAGLAPTVYRGPGAHVRHVIDHYECLLRGLPDGRVDYDARERDRLLEVDPAAARARLASLVRRLGPLAGREAEEPLAVRLDLGVKGGRSADWTRSSLGRELAFLASHTVHHYAIVALLLRGQGVDPGEEFGVAPSTLRHRSERASCPA